MGKISIYNRLFGGTNMKGGAKIGNLIKLMNEKKEFLILVFANLIAQLGITYYVMERTNKLDISIWLLLAAQLIIIFVMVLVPMPEFVKFLLFCFFSYTSGLVLSLLKKKKNYSSDMIRVAIQGALTVFAFMLATGVALFAGGINLGYKYGSILFWSLLALIVARLVFPIKMNQGHKILSFIGIILFAIYVVYDTNKILQRDYYGGVISASLDYYLDIFNLFTNFLRSSDN